MTSERGAKTGAEAGRRTRGTAEALAAHLEAGEVRPAGLDESDGEAAELASLLRLARRLDERMKPVHPSPAFVQSLGGELRRHAQRRIARRQKRHRIAMISAAVAGGVVSIASLVGGIVVLVKWLRTRGEARQASTA